MRCWFWKTRAVYIGLYATEASASPDSAFAACISLNIFKSWQGHCRRAEKYLWQFNYIVIDIDFQQDFSPNYEAVEQEVEIRCEQVKHRQSRRPVYFCEFEIPQHSEAGGEKFRESRTDAKRAALPWKRQCDFESILFALKISCPPRKQSVCTGANKVERFCGERTNSEVRELLSFYDETSDTQLAGPCEPRASSS